jgi:hypothetical protein
MNYDTGNVKAQDDRCTKIPIVLKNSTIVLKNSSNSSNSTKQYR